MAENAVPVGVVYGEIQNKSESATTSKSSQFFASWARGQQLSKGQLARFLKKRLTKGKSNLDVESCHYGCEIQHKSGMSQRNLRQKIIRLNSFRAESILKRHWIIISVPEVGDRSSSSTTNRQLVTFNSCLQLKKKKLAGICFPMPRMMMRMKCEKEFPFSYSVWLE